MKPGFLPRQGQQTWSGVGQMQNNDSWGSCMQQHPFMQQAPTMPQQMPQQTAQSSEQQLVPAMHPQQPQMMMVQVSVPTPQVQQSMQMMPVPCNHGVQTAQSPQVQQLQMSVPMMSGENSPADFNRCMAICMPQAAQFPCDKDLMAAQLKAAADCQRYED